MISDLAIVSAHARFNSLKGGSYAGLSALYCLCTHIIILTESFSRSLQ